eukprot:NODE_2659_length_1526_cov_39.602994_g2291_i0.p1 GENE.NODE_2659_length_1526_cov_39.602994_g2291_i0~~NODE_2659_length_1526_cov_39.602994_g2291_i0.p1  ORF type:complete len:446 (-),score=86.42 NODE_2659_length_1526_cov_39.602994_g2291_i0:135-1472(-)
MEDEEYDGDQYEFEYTDDDEGPDAMVDVENQYYNSKGEMESNPKEALEGFQTVLEMEKENPGRWGFKSLKQICKLMFLNNQPDEMLKRYQELLTYSQTGSVTRNDREKVINKLVDFVSTAKPDSDSNFQFLAQFYETTLACLNQSDRLWFGTKVKLCRMCFESKDYQKMQKILKELYLHCEGSDGQEDSKKGTQLQEVYALEIQLCTELKNHKKLKELYNKSTKIKSAIPHPRIMGVIRECGGKMHMSEGDWAKAHTDFFEAFKNYDEAGHPRRIHCLKYLVLANMLAVSKINPFDSPEAKPYRDTPEILAMTDLLNSYEQNHIKEFERILQNNKQSIMGDAFIRLYIEDLLRTIRTQVLINLIKPYTKITISYISSELNIPPEDVESLLVALILDNKISGHIDQINQVLELRDSQKADTRYTDLSRWANHIANLHSSITNKITH